MVARPRAENLHRRIFFVPRDFLLIDVLSLRRLLPCPRPKKGRMRCLLIRMSKEIVFVEGFVDLGELTS